MSTKYSETKFLIIIALVQFINILDFMMVMPMGPDFAGALNIPIQHLGYIGGSYTMAAAFSGLIGALVLDWYDRKKVILITLIGLGFATILPCFAKNFEMMIGARILAGLFGGPLTASALAMIADVVPLERRGTVMGKVMGSFSLASVFGVPFGLELARHFGWQAPFAILGVIALIVFVMARKFLPENANQKAERNIRKQIKTITLALRNPLAWSAWGITAFATIGAFVVIPNMASYLQLNMDYPRAQLSWLYLAGGAATFFGMRVVGRMVDKTSATFVSLLSTLLLGVTVYFTLIDLRFFSAYVLFIGFMVANTARNVAAQTISSKVPEPKERAGYMSIQTTITHAGCAIGAFIGSVILTEGADGRLQHIDTIGWFCIAMALMIPPLFWNTERLLSKRQKRVTPDPVVAGLPDTTP